MSSPSHLTAPIGAPVEAAIEAAVEAVVTTGIYCRPGCSARPKPENTRPYPSAAAAEVAGFRACLRCRPYRTDVPAPRAGPELVCRGVQLILDGALDAPFSGGEAELGARSGASPRHLRRLFVEHLGATPDALRAFAAPRTLPAVSSTTRRCP